MPSNPQSEQRPRSFYSYLILGAGLFVFLQAFHLLSPIVLSFVLILLISLAVNPLISRIRALTGGRKAATGLVAFTLVAIIALTGWAFFVPMKTSVTKLVEQLPTYWERFQKPLIKIEKQAVLSEEKLQAEVTREIAKEAPVEVKPETPRRAVETAPAGSPKEPGSLRAGLTQMLHGVAGSFRAVALNATQIVVVLVTVFFGVTFTLMNPRPILGAIFAMVPEHHHERTLTILQRIGKFMPDWALATVLGMATIGLLVFLVMWPLFGFVDALVLGVIAGLFEAIPYVGPILSAVPALLFALGAGGSKPLWVLLAYVAVQALENNIICPLIMARSMKLHPVAVIFSMLLCVAAFGVLGLLIAPPMVAIVVILHDELYRKRFLPTVTEAGMERLARKALNERLSEGN